ncbi:MAG: hypothetical protein CFH26_00776 [Alphaproteobacteria bacterium MarineAlpha6_Bin4]|nr:MAG: hypothetical protein CFH26_00776 [Alphaproteobacteria bacterium MarineAlpha6_Bin4]|tara:strand:+ start:6878 stop:7882 length:1005 start_codon:yes stop_codon:yes gene_type:complete
MRIIGWDIGGAHVKAIIIDFKKKKLKSSQIYCPIWKNLNNLKKAIKLTKKKLGKCDYHSVTMTAELSDAFINRKRGSKYIIKLTSKILNTKKTFFYNKNKFIKKNIALKKTNINSLNWHAIGNFISNFYPNSILVDIGSTTTDIIPIKNKKIISKGSSDYKRLNYNELLYIGVIRSPIHAVEKKKKIIYENFANLSDVYRILNKIPKKNDLAPTLDNKDKNKHSNARRIARVYGKDYKKKDFERWKKVASKIEKKQINILKKNISKIKKENFKNDVPIIGAGVGKFLLKDACKKKKYYPFESNIKNTNSNKVVNCETAVSVAILLKKYLKQINN